MAMNLLNLREMLQAMTGDYTSQTATLYDRFINMAARDLESAWEWPETLADEWVVTAKPYDTGSITLTNGSPNVTGVGTVFPSDSATTPRRLALSYTDPWYTVKTRSTDTALILDEDYSEDTAAASNYVLYADKFSLASTVESIRHVLVLRSGYTNPAALTERRMDELATLPVGIGVPTSWATDGYDSSGCVTLRVRPVPDDVYRLLVRYRKKYIELDNPTDVPVLLEKRRDLIVERALWHAYRMRADNRAAADQLVIYQRRLGEAIHNERLTGNAPQFKRCDTFVDSPWFNYSWPAEAP